MAPVRGGERNIEERGKDALRASQSTSLLLRLAMGGEEASVAKERKGGGGGNWPSFPYTLAYRDDKGKERSKT